MAIDLGRSANATAVLLTFRALGNWAMSRDIANAGSISSCIARGLGRVPGVTGGGIALVGDTMMQCVFCAGSGSRSSDLLLPRAVSRTGYRCAGCWGWGVLNGGVVSAEVERVRRLMDGLRRDRRTHPLRGRREYSQRAREVAGACEALMRTEPGAVPALARRAVDLVTTALMYLDDSSGVVGDDLHQLMGVHARACALAPPDPQRLAGWLATLRLDGPGWPDFELRDYQAALGHTGRVELARIVEERAATAEPDVSGRTPFGIRILREQLAEISGDLDHYVAVLAEHLDSARQYLQIVRALRSAGRVAEAEQWAQRGLRIGNPIDQGKLTEAYEGLLLERDAADEAFALRWDLFEQNPTAAHYTALRRTAGRLGEGDTLRDDALARMRRAAARQPAFANELVDALLEDEAWEQAWQEGLEHAEELPASRWHRLIELRQPTHPAEVIAPWQRLIRQRLQASGDKYRYTKVITMLGKLREAYRACGNPDGFATYLDELRTQHQRKTALLAKLDRIHL